MTLGCYAQPFAFMWAFTASRNASASREGLRWRGRIARKR